MRKPTRAALSLKPGFTSLLILIAALLLLFALLATAVTPERLDLRAGDVAPRTITATKDVQDTIGTQALIDDAVRAVQPSYTSDATVMPAVMAELKEAFTGFVALGVPDGEAAGECTDDALRQAARRLAPAELTDEALRAVLSTAQAELSSLSADAQSLVRETLNGKLPEGQEAAAVSKVKRDLVGEGYDEALSQAAGAMVQAFLRANMLLDEETTAQNREKAAAEVEPIGYKKGQNVIQKGEVVTANQIEVLNNLGMLKDRGIDWTLFGGIAAVLILLALVELAYLLTFEPELIHHPRSVALLSTICVAVVALSLFLRGFSSYLMPVTLGAMLVTLLLKPRLALVTNTVLSLIAALMATVESGVFTSTSLSVLFSGFVSGSVCVSLLRKRQYRAGVLLTGLIAGCVSAASSFAMGLLTSDNIAGVAWGALWSALSGVLASVFCIGCQPALEWGFNLVTNVKLMELSNPNQPLLRRLMIEAPGTYHHSIIVANLAEAAANAVGANGLLARVGAYYHDVGKLKRPIYFKENQLHDNPHDRTDPRVSTAILTAHPRDGVELGVRYRLPEPIREIIQQHHGDTPVLYFYDRALKRDGEADIADFRYEGPRPRSREAAIVMLADTIEAAARAMSESTPERMSQMIRRLVRSKLEDGQLDECRLTFADINLICEAFLTVLTGVYHERIEYPTVAVPERPLEKLPEAGHVIEPAIEPEQETNA